MQAIKGVGAGTAEWKETYTLESFSPSSSTLLEVVVYNHNTLRPDSMIGEQQDPCSSAPSESCKLCIQRYVFTIPLSPLYDGVLSLE